MTVMTLEERERRAYIEGRTEEAGMFAMIVDSKPDELADLLEDIDDLKRENRRLKAIVGEYEGPKAEN